MIKNINNPSTMAQVSEHSAVHLIVDEASEGQRIDNFLQKVLKGVPKSHVYRILRSGEVRVNKKRVNAECRLQLHDDVRVPPIRIKPSVAPFKDPEKIIAKLEQTILFEDDAMLVLNKPAGMAVHGGSGISLGVIEQLRLERPLAKFLELVHRLDRETSGVLMVAKKRSALVALHEAIRHNRMDKRYLMMVKGIWQGNKQHIKLALQKYVTAEGERRVNVVDQLDQRSHYNAQMSETIFYLKRQWKDYALLEAKLITGRTHQLRVQLAHLGFPILGDDKYGDFALNKWLSKHGLKRMFLHSAITNIQHPLRDEPLKLMAPLPSELQAFIEQQERSQAKHE